MNIGKSQSITKASLKLIALIIGIFVFGQSVLVSAQPVTKSSDKGFTPGKSYLISDIETISRQGGNLMLSVPLGSLPAGRGGMSAGINLKYNSKIWDMTSVSVEGPKPQDNYTINALKPSNDGGWKYAYKYYLKSDHAGSPCGQSPYQEKLFLVAPDGGQHVLNVQSGGLTDREENSNIFPDGVNACSQTAVTPGQIIRLFSTDGSFLRLEVTTDSDTDFTNNQWTLYLPDGTRVMNRVNGSDVQRVIDRNGNFISIEERTSDSNYSGRRTTTFVDELNRKVVIDYDAVVDNTANTSEDHIHSKGFNGADITTKVKWKTIRVNKIYNACGSEPCYPPVDYLYNTALNETHRVVEKVFLPSQIGGNLFYEFQYNADSTSAADIGYGEVSKVILPSEAESAYEYKYDAPGTPTTENILKNLPVKKTLTYDLEYDGQTSPTSEVWTYERVEAGTNNYSKMTMPDGGVSIEHYSTSEDLSAFPNAPQFVVGEAYKTENPDGSVAETYYASNTPSSTNPFPYQNNLFKANRYVKYEFNSLRNAAGTLTQTAIREYSRDKNGNVTEVKEYDFVPYSSVPRTSGRPTGLPSNASAYLKRITKTAYYNDTPDASSGNYTDADSYHVGTSKRLLNLVKSVEIQDAAGTPQSRSEMYYDFTDYSGTNTKGGNAVESRNWDSTKQATLQSADSNGYKLVSSNYINSLVSYDSYGNPTQTTDAKGIQTNVTYGAVNGYMGLYPTQTIAAYGTAIARTSTTTYDFYTGLAMSATDVDNNLTTATEYDDLGRPTKAKAAVGTALEVWTQTVYDDAERKVIVKSDVETKGDARKVATQFYDQLGRIRLSKTLENAATQSATNENDGIKVQTRYATTTTGYTYQLSSNPYRGANLTAAANEPEMGWTRSASHKDGKHSESETFAGASLPAPWGNNSNSTGKVQTDVDADKTMVTDQAGKRRISKTTALGQLENVWEITSADSATEAVTFSNLSLNGYRTSYDYDILNNLINVKQGGTITNPTQLRTFTYTSLSRLKSANNPESGVINYTYDNNGNLLTKTDARTITTTFTYDALNRVTFRDYSDSTYDVAYTYDNLPNAKGKLTKVLNGQSSGGVIANPFSVTEYQQFDSMGRVTQSQQTTDGAAYPQMTYTYNLSGALIEQKYPSGRVVKNVLDNDGDLSIVQSKKNQNAGFWNYADNFTYTAAGAVSSMQLGNGRWESTQFNSRLQPLQIALGTVQNGTDKLKLNFSYNTTGQNDNNGNVLNQTITVPTETRNSQTYTGFTATQTYTYDALNRLKSAEETIPSQTGWKQTFDYDRYGNRTFNEANTTASMNFPKSCSGAMCAADKKIFNPQAQTLDNKFSTVDGYQYDLAGNTTRDAQSRKFTYDAENKQTKVETVDSNGTVIATIGEYFYNGDGKRVKKVVPVTGETTVFIYDAAGKLVAENSTLLSSTQTVSYLTNDHLGSSRINTDQNGNVMARHDYQPFGEEIARASYGADANRKQFTGYERDKETDLDFAQARMYANRLGRFTTTDPIIMSPDRVIDPQIINLYQYARSNPLKFTDSTGEEIDDADLKDNTQYQAWKEKCMKTKACEKQWEKYDKMTNFTLKMTVVNRGDKNKGAEVKDFVFDKDKNFVGATMELGTDLSSSGGANGSNYPVMSKFVAESGVSGNKKAVGKIGHEFGHLDDFLSLGNAFYEQQQVLMPYTDKLVELQNKGLSTEEIFERQDVNKLKQDIIDKTGHTPGDLNKIRENRAELFNIPVIRQLSGNTETLNAARTLENKPPKY